jgi:hypothetical protein
MSDMQGDQSESPLAISHPMPALRLNQRDVELNMLRQDGSIEGPESPTLASSRPPAGTRWIRPLRGGAGILLLALAWLGLLTIVFLIHAAIHDEPLKLWPLGIQSVLPLIELLGVIWLGIAVAMSLLVGAFLLWLALTVRGW